MRNALGELQKELLSGARPDHAGLAYERWAPLDANDKDKGRWLDAVASCRRPADYRLAFERWKSSLDRHDTLTLPVRARSRVLIGHGNPTAAEVGLTLHHTWGVPVLPGSALKGLASNYVQTVYGPDPTHPEPDREPFRGVGWSGSRITRAPGALFQRLFGAPDADEGGEEARARRGEIIFHDALWIPAEDEMLARDVLTVHQKSWYRKGADWPNDYDPPNPVGFLTVRPGVGFLVALSLAPGATGGEELLRRAARYLGEALREWGLGGKTVAGYGRFDCDEKDSRVPKRRGAAPAMLAELEAWLRERSREQVPQRAQLERLEAEWLGRWLPLPSPAREEVARLLERTFHRLKEKPRARLDQILQRLAAGR